MSDVYVVTGTDGEDCARNAWVVGVYTEKEAAERVAEERKAADLADVTGWTAWADELQQRIKRRRDAGESFAGKDWLADRAEIAARLGMPEEPWRGFDRSEYRVAQVPLNKAGIWGYA